MVDFAHIIEKDDIEQFKLHFNKDAWKEPVAKIQNYAFIDKETLKDFPFIKHEEHYDDADCVKYALHCNADKIFNYLLPFVHVDKHNDNYGWPLLAMALQNNRYDYADSIIHHHSFNVYPMYHTNTFSYINSRPNVDAHIEFLFDYLELFNAWVFEDKRYVHDFTHLICHNEDTFKRFEQCYQKKLKSDASLMHFFEGKMDILGDEIFSRKYNPFIIEKLTVDNIKEIIKSAHDVFFVSLFEEQHAKEGIVHLLKCQDAFIQYLDNNNIMLSYMPLECIVLLMQHGFDIWKENKDNLNALDFIVKDIEDEKTHYFVNMYPQEIFDRLHAKGRKNAVQRYCQNILLEKELPHSEKKSILPKI